jgi:fatty acid desaturase
MIIFGLSHFDYVHKIGDDWRFTHVFLSLLVIHFHMPSPIKAKPPASPIEWPTWLLIVTIHGAWVALLLGYQALPAGLGQIGLVAVAAWHLSLQHELLHGHPTRRAALNQLFGVFPISVWYPFAIYLDSHLIHHRDAQLTEPGLDPEGNYVKATAYQQAWPAWRALQWALRTVVGRFLLGPLLAISTAWWQLVTALWRRDGTYLGDWLVHLLLLLPMLWWVHAVSGLTPLHYLLGIAYPALGLAMLRSFYEHRPADLPAHRIVINEAAWPWRLLYLNNNYHAVHHAHPGLAWYRIPAAYRADRAGYLQRNGGFLLKGYARLLWRHGLRPVDSPIHPGLKP